MNLADIGATIILESNSEAHCGAANVFDNGCDIQGNYFCMPNNYDGLAFKLDLGAVYNISQFRLRNIQNSIHNDKYVYYFSKYSGHRLM